MNFGLQPQR